MSLVAYASSDEDSPEETVKQEVLKKRETVKISIPSLNEFKDEEIPEKVIKPKPKGGSGLFSILPPPKNLAVLSKPGFTPYVFSKKKEVKVPEGAKTHPKKVQNTQEKIKPNNMSNNSEIPEDTTEDNLENASDDVDFFSLNTNTSKINASNFDDLAPSILTTNIPDLPKVTANVSEDDTISIPHEVKSESLPPYENISLSSNEGIPMSSTNSDFFPHNVSEPGIPFADMIPGPSEPELMSDITNPADIKKFFKLSKREMENINFIDVNAADQLTGKDELVLQSLTQEKVHRPSKRGHDFPTQQQKRKHQITFLAHQAKERELDLKNQWSHNSRTRRETQAKYGF